MKNAKLKLVCHGLMVHDDNSEMVTTFVVSRSSERKKTIVHPIPSYKKQIYKKR